MYDLVIIGGGPAGVAAGVYAARKKIKTVLITDSFGGQSLVSDRIGNWIGEKEISGFDLAQKMEAHLKAQKDIEIVEGEWVVSIERTTLSHPESAAGGEGSFPWRDSSLPTGVQNDRGKGGVQNDKRDRYSDSPPLIIRHPESAAGGEGSPNVGVNPRFMIKTKSGKTYAAKTILLTAGSRRKKLDVPGEKEFEGKGVVYCSTCDAPLFDGKDVAVVGGGNSGLEAVVDLLPYAQTIFLLHHGSALKGDPLTLEKINPVRNSPPQGPSGAQGTGDLPAQAGISNGVKADTKVRIILNAETQSVSGEQGVTGLVYKDLATGDVQTLAVQGVFVEIGIVPNGELVKGMCEINRLGEVTVNHGTQKTSCPGIWAAGDATDVLYKQNNISAGDAVKAVLNIYDYLRGVERT